ncbi:MAG: hypothetical protein QM504_09790, partial [Pseudomonadota bacterium]
MASVNVNSMDMFNASELSYGQGSGVALSALSANGYIPDINFNTTDNSATYKDASTGFSVTALINTTTGDRILAFTGTEGVQDGYADISLGWDQWIGNQGRNRQIVMDYVQRSPQNATVHFTGHSLGGGLAQYATYDYLDIFVNTPGNEKLPLPNITLTTFNGLGGQDGLAQNVPNFDAGLISRVPNSGTNIRHYRSPGDIVSRLGEGHLGGNVYLIGSQNDDLATAHIMTTLRSTINAQGGFIVDDVLSTDEYVHISAAQRSIYSFANALSLPMLGDASEFGDAEGGLRALAGLMVGLSTAPASEVNNLIQAIGKNFQAAGLVVDQQAYDVFMSYRWGELFQSYGPGNIQRGADSAAILAPLIEAGLQMTGYTAGLMDYLIDGLLDQVYIFGTTDSISFFAYLTAQNDFELKYGSDLFEVARQIAGTNRTDISVTNVTLSEAGTGTLTITLNNIVALDWDQNYVIRVSDPQRISLSGGLVSAVANDPGAYSVLIPQGQNSYTIDVQSLVEDANDLSDNAVQFEVVYAPYGNLDNFYRDDTRLSSGVITITDTTVTQNFTEVIGQGTYLDAGSFGYSETTYNPNASLNRTLENGYDVTIDNGSNNTRSFVDLVVIPRTDSSHYWLPDTWAGQTRYGNVAVADNGQRYVYIDQIYDYFLLPETDPNYLPVPTVGNVPYSAGSVIGIGYFPVYGNATVFSREGNDLITTAYGNDQVLAGDGRDVIHTGPGDDVVFGGDGDDVIDGESGNDQLMGGDGNDVISGGYGDDVIYGGDGNDYLDGEALRISYTNPNIPYPIKTLIVQGNYSYQILEQQRPYSALATVGMSINTPYALDGVNNFQIVAPDVNFPIDIDTVAYYLGDDFIDGGKGNDYIIGWGGDDSLYGGDDNDTVNGGTGNDLIDGGNGDDWLIGWRGNDTIYGGAGHDAILGNHGNDYLYGEAGHDVIYGDGFMDDPNNPGQQIADPNQNGNDYLSGGAGNDDLLGGFGNDILYGGADDDNLWGEDGDDFLSGDAGKDILYGDAGDDYLEGGKGDDQLSGGAGIDQLYGGDGQ